MVAISRLGNALILGGALALTGLMTYTLVGVGPSRIERPRQPVSPPEVAVVFPDRADWRDFRQGIVACERLGLLKIVAQEDGAVVIATPRRSRSLRFTWAPAQGAVETRWEVRRRLESPTAPLAFVGSSNTALTTALATELHAGTNGTTDVPMLLIPWATSVRAEVADGHDPSPLLAIHQGRSFRFCPNNQQQASLVVDCLRSRDKVRPARVYLVVDPADPYSVDLADCFRKSLEAVAPGVETIAFRDVVTHSGPDDQPTPEDVAWAMGIAKSLASSPPDHPTWIVLPLQSEPSRRLLRALRTAFKTELPPQKMPVEILCGDGIGLETLGEFAGGRSLSIWSASAAAEVQSAPIDTQVSAEIVAALAIAVDQADHVSTESVRRSLGGLHWRSPNGSDRGRSLSFTKDGERSGADLGRVFHAGPARAEILSFVRDRSGAWPEPASIHPPAVEVRQ